ncbi:hypothetical protein [Niabella hibiscisoli]|uniref:hypothetical protein n=1 Tax=Niabella hibiscisoli TaxID=1825928 RepID=UPI001F10E7E6|nr:hypothetical protein [Niabella hibiscisoli]MCH5714792.1 hypothetical protein [Niabella hibiscisoli]
MERDKPINISLTGNNSHQIKIPPGQGSFSMGLAGMDKKKFDVLIEDDFPVNWDAFNELYTPHGQQHAEKYPYGDWPRFFHYWGKDTGFVTWSAKRAIEDFSWHPGQSVSVDLSNAGIRNLSVKANEHPVELVLGNKTSDRSALQTLALAGNIHYFKIKTDRSDIYLKLNPDTLHSRSATPYQLPVFASLAKINALDITVAPLGQAFDCESLLQFPHLASLNLSGNIVNTHCLKELRQLERLGIRYTPDLENFPLLHSWGQLKSFIGWNIEADTGKRLNAELKLLAKQKELDYSSVSKLRSKIWFTTEYGIPFTNWDGKKAATATKAYKAALKAIGNAKAETEVYHSITELVQLINRIPGIETVEREDTGLAVRQLVEASSLNIPQETADKWFDELREF